MKRIKKILILFLLLIPFVVNANDITRNYNETVTRANNYINAFENKDRYLIFGNFYGFNNSGATTNASFSTGGLISKKEFDATIYKNHSWLATGSEYWTQSEESGLRWYIDTRAEKKADDRLSGVRVTEFVHPNTVVRGSGTSSNPWVFVGQYSVRIVPNKNESGIGVDPMYQLIQSGQTATIKVTETAGIMYTGEDDCGLEFDSNVSKYVKKYKVTPTKDINCVANFDVRKITVNYNCNGGSGSVADQTIVYGTNYTLAPKSCTKDGYIQTGWIAGTTNYSLSQTGTWTTEEGTGGVSGGKLNLKAVYNDVQSPKVTVTAYKYDSTKTNGVGNQIKDPFTVYDTSTSIGTLVNKTETYVVSDSWLNHAVVFKVESTDNTGVSSITFKYNNANSYTDTGTSYPNSTDKGTTQIQYPSYNTAGNGQGWRNGQWIVKDAKGNTTTVKLVAKIDTTPPTCTLNVTTSGVSIARNDNLNVAGYGLIKSTTPTYNSTTTLALSTGDFWGYVKDSANNTGNCKVNLKNTDANKWTKTSEKCISYYSSASGTYSKSNNCTTSTCSTSGCSCSGWAASGSYSYTSSCSCTTSTCSKSGCSCSTTYSYKNKDCYSCSPYNCDQLCSGIGAGWDDYAITDYTCGCRKATGTSASGTYSCSKSANCTTSTCSKSGCSCYYTSASGTYTTSHSCTTSTCSKSGCSCVTSYKFDTATNATNQTSCTNNSFDCDVSTENQVKTTCTATGWTCSSGYTKLNNTYCYK